MATNLYVNIDWAGSEIGDLIIDQGKVLYFGTNAFADVQSAVNAASTDEATTINVHAGTYANDIIFHTYFTTNQKADIVIQAADGTAPADVVITGGIQVGLRDNDPKNYIDGLKDEMPIVIEQGKTNQCTWKNNVTFKNVTIYGDNPEHDICPALTDYANGKGLTLDCCVLDSIQLHSNYAKFTIKDCIVNDSYFRTRGTSIDHSVFQGGVYTGTRINIDAGSTGKGTVIKNVTFNNTLTDDYGANTSFYAIRSRANTVDVSGCTFNVDSTMTDPEATPTEAGDWSVLRMRTAGSTLPWTIDGCTVNFSEDAAKLAGLDFIVNDSTSSNAINVMTVSNLTATTYDEQGNQLSGDAAVAALAGDSSGYVGVVNADGSKTLYDDGTNVGSNDDIFVNASWTSASELPEGAVWGFNAFSSFTNAYNAVAADGTITVSGDNAVDGAALTDLDKAVTIDGAGKITLGTATVSDDIAVAISDVKLTAENLTNKGTITASGTATFEITTLSENGIDFADGVIVKDSTIGGVAYLEAGATVSLSGTNTVNNFGWATNAAYDEDSKIIVGKGASLATGIGGRVSLGYGRTYDITGSIAEDAALTIEDKSTVAKSFDVADGITFVGFGDNVLNVKNAYVAFGGSSTPSKGITGTYEMSFTNSIVDFASLKVFERSTDTDIDITFDGSVLYNTGHLTNENFDATMTFKNGTQATATSSFKNGGEFQVLSGSKFTANSVIQYGENSGNDGSILVDGADSEMTLTNGNIASAFKSVSNASITVTGGGKFTSNYIINEGLITVDATSSLIASGSLNNSGDLLIFADDTAGITVGSFTNSGTITIDVTKITGDTADVIFVTSDTGTAIDKNAIKLTGEGASSFGILAKANGGVSVAKVGPNVYVNSAWDEEAEGESVELTPLTGTATKGLDAFEKFDDALVTAGKTIYLYNTTNPSTELITGKLEDSVLKAAGEEAVSITFDNAEVGINTNTLNGDLTIGEDVTFGATIFVHAAAEEDAEITVDGTFDVLATTATMFVGTMTVNGKVVSTGESAGALVIRDGYSLVVNEGAEVNVNTRILNATATFTNASMAAGLTIANSKGVVNVVAKDLGMFSAASIENSGTINLVITSADIDKIDVTKETYKLINITGTGAALSTSGITVNGDKWDTATKSFTKTVGGKDYTYTLVQFDNDICLSSIVVDPTKVYVNADWANEGYEYGAKITIDDKTTAYYGITAFSSVVDAYNSGSMKGATTTVIKSNGTEKTSVDNKDIIVETDGAYTLTGGDGGFVPYFEIDKATSTGAKTTLEITDADIMTQKFGARRDGIVYVNDSEIMVNGTNDTNAVYYNGTEIITDSVIWAMQTTVEGVISVTGDDSVFNHTWQTSVWYNGQITVSDGATWKTAAFQVGGTNTSTSDTYIGRKNPDIAADAPATFIVDGAILDAGYLIKSKGEADYSYNTSYGIEVGTFSDAKFDILNDSVATLYTNGIATDAEIARTIKFGEYATVTVEDSELNIGGKHVDAASFSNAGTITLQNGATLNATIATTNSGTINVGNEAVKAVAAVPAVGEPGDPDYAPAVEAVEGKVASAGTLTAATLTNTGAINAFDGSAIESTGTINNDAGGTINLGTDPEKASAESESATLTANSIVNRGTINAVNGAVISTTGGSFANYKDITLNASSITNKSGQLVVWGAASLVAENGSTIAVSQLINKKTTTIIDSTVTVSSEAGIRVDSGVFSVGGASTLTAKKLTGTIELLDGANITATINAGGTFNVGKHVETIEEVETEVGNDVTFTGKNVFADTEVENDGNILIKDDSSISAMRIANKGTITAIGTSTIDADIVNANTVNFGTKDAALATTYAKTLTGRADINGEGTNVKLTGTMQGSADPKTKTESLWVIKGATLTVEDGGVVKNYDSVIFRGDGVFKAGSQLLNFNTAYLPNTTGAVEFNGTADNHVTVDSRENGNVVGAVYAYGNMTADYTDFNLGNFSVAGIEDKKVVVTINNSTMNLYAGLSVGQGDENTTATLNLKNSTATVGAVRVGRLIPVDYGIGTGYEMNLTNTTITAQTTGQRSQGTVIIDAGNTLTMDTNSQIKFFSSWTNEGTLTVNVEGKTGAYCLVDNTGSSSMDLADYGKVTLVGSGSDDFDLQVIDNDLWAINTGSSKVLYVNNTWTTHIVGGVKVPYEYGDPIDGREGLFFELNAFNNAASAIAAMGPLTTNLKFENNNVTSEYPLAGYTNLTQSLTIDSDAEKTALVGAEVCFGVDTDTPPNADTVADPRTFTINGNVEFDDMGTGKYGDTTLNINGNVTVRESAWFRANTHTIIAEDASFKRAQSGNDGQLCVYGTVDVLGTLDYYTEGSMGTTLRIGSPSYTLPGILNVTGSAASLNIHADAEGKNYYAPKIESNGFLNVKEGATATFSGEVKNEGTITIGGADVAAVGTEGEPDYKPAVAGAGSLTADTITNSGSIDVTNGSTLTATGIITNNGEFSATGSTILAKATGFGFVNNETLTIDSSTVTVGGGAAILKNEGSGAKQITIQNDSTVNAGLYNYTGATVTIIESTVGTAGAYVKNWGTIEATDAVLKASYVQNYGTFNLDNGKFIASTIDVVNQNSKLLINQSVKEGFVADKTETAISTDSLSNVGTIKAKAATINATTFTNSGTFEGSNVDVTTDSLSNVGTIKAKAATINATVFTNSGTFDGSNVDVITTDVITNSGTFGLENATVIASSVSLGEDANFNARGDLTLKIDELEGTITVNADATFTKTSITGGVISVAAETTVAFNSVESGELIFNNGVGDITNAGTITVEGTLNAGAITNAGAETDDTGSNLLSAKAISNAGTIYAYAGSTITATGTGAEGNSSNSGTINAYGATLNVTGVSTIFQNTGTIYLKESAVLNTQTFSNYGSITVDKSTVTFGKKITVAKTFTAQNEAIVSGSNLTVRHNAFSAENSTVTATNIVISESGYNASYTMDGGSLTAGTITTAANGTFEGNGTIAVTSIITNNGEFALTGGSLTAKEVVNNSEFTVSGTGTTVKIGKIEDESIVGGLTGTINVANGATLSADTAIYKESGAGGSTVEFDAKVGEGTSSITVASGAVINTDIENSNADLKFEGDLKTLGTITNKADAKITMVSDSASITGASIGNSGTISGGKIVGTQIGNKAGAEISVSSITGNGIENSGQIAVTHNIEETSEISNTATGTITAANITVTGNNITNKGLIGATVNTNNEVVLNRVTKIKADNISNSDANAAIYAGTIETTGTISNSGLIDATGDVTAGSISGNSASFTINGATNVTGADGIHLVYGSASFNGDVTAYTFLAEGVGTTVTFGAHTVKATNGRIQISSDAACTANGTILDENQIFAYSNNFTIKGNASLKNVTGAGLLTFEGVNLTDASVSGCSVSVTADNSTFKGTNSFGNLTVAEGAALNLAEDASLTAAITNNGTINAEAGTTISGTADNIENSGLLSLKNATVTSGSWIENLTANSSVEATEGSKINTSISNSGSVLISDSTVSADNVYATETLESEFIVTGDSKLTITEFNGTITLIDATLNGSNVADCANGGTIVVGNDLTDEDAEVTTFKGTNTFGNLTVAEGAALTINAQAPTTAGACLTVTGDLTNYGTITIDADDLDPLTTAAVQIISVTKDVNVAATDIILKNAKVAEDYKGYTAQVIVRTAGDDKGIYLCAVPGDVDTQTVFVNNNWTDDMTETFIYGGEDVVIGVNGFVSASSAILGNDTAELKVASTGKKYDGETTGTLVMKQNEKAEQIKLSVVSANTGDPAPSKSVELYKLSIVDSENAIVAGIFKLDNLSVVNSTVKFDGVDAKAAATSLDDRSTLNLFNTTATNLGAITGIGKINTDWESTLTFTGFAEGKLDVDMDGFAGGSAKVVDYAGTEDPYTAMLGEKYNKYFLKATAASGYDLVTNTFARNVTTISSATSATDLRTKIDYSWTGNVTGGTYYSDNVVIDDGTYNFAVYFNNNLLINATTYETITKATNTSAISIDGGKFDASVFGGLKLATAEGARPATEVIIGDDINMTINDGTFTYNVYGGDNIKQGGYYYREGDITLTVNGGTFKQQLVAGMLYNSTTQARTSVSVDSTNLIIQGGTFEGGVYGGNSSLKYQGSQNTSIIGDATVTIVAGTVDAKNVSRTIDLNKLTVGSYGYGAIDGNTHLILTGSATRENLEIGSIWGGCGGDYYTEGDKRSYVSECISGARILSFTGFTTSENDPLNCKAIYGFSDVTVTADENGVLTNAELRSEVNLSDVSNWAFEAGNTLDGAFKNDFKGDTLALTGLDGYDLTKDWVLFGDTTYFTNFDGFAKDKTSGKYLVTFDGDNAWKELDSNNEWTGAWVTDTYRLSINESNQMVLGLA